MTDIETINYRFDKHFDYFKLLILIHITVLGLLANLKSSYPVENLDWFYPTILMIFSLSLSISIYGCFVLMDDRFEKRKNHHKILTFCRNVSGLTLVAGIISAILRII